MEIVLIVLGLVALGGSVLGFLRLTRRHGGGDELDPEVDAVLRVAPPGTVIDGIVEDRTVHSTPERPIGYRLFHRKGRNQMIVIPVMSQPLAAPYTCPTCRTAHVVKSVHLLVDGEGHVIVSKGVLELLRLAGLEANHLEFQGAVSKPPPLRAGHGTSRAEIDHNNRKIVMYKTI